MTTQKQKLHSLLSDGLPHRTDEIARVVYGEKGEVCETCGRGEAKSLARVGARIFDLKKDGHTITGRKDKLIPSLYWYQMTIPATPCNDRYMLDDQYDNCVDARLEAKENYEDNRIEELREEARDD